jgi:hypothetical protein
MYSANRTKYQASVLIATAAGLLGAALAQREPASCECRVNGAVPVQVLPEVEVVATRLPP